MTPSGIKPVACRFVAWCLNHYAIGHPNNISTSQEYLMKLDEIKNLSLWTVRIMPQNGSYCTIVHETLNSTCLIIKEYELFRVDDGGGRNL